MTKAEKLYVLSLTRYFTRTLVSGVVYSGALAARPEHIQAIFSINRHRLVSVLEKAGQLARYKRAVLTGRCASIKEYRSRLDARTFLLFDSADFLLPAGTAPEALDLESEPEHEPEHEEVHEAADVPVGLGVCFLLFGTQVASLIEVRVQVPHADSRLTLGDRRIAQLAFAGLLHQHKVSLPGDLASG